MSKLGPRVALLVAIGLTLVWLDHTGHLSTLTSLSTYREVLARNVALGSLAYVVVHGLLAAVGIPSVVFLVPAPLVFGTHEAFALGTLGAWLGSYLGFVLARGTLRESLAPRIPARLRRLDDRIEQRGLHTVVMLRLTLFLLPPVAWALGLTRVDTRTYMLGTLIGMLPGVAFCSYVGGSFVAWLTAQPPWVFVLAAVASAVVLVLRRRRAADEPAAS